MAMIADDEIDEQSGPKAPPPGTIAATQAMDVYASYGGQLIAPGFGRDLSGVPVILNPDVILAHEDKRGLRSQLYDQMLVKDAKLAGLWKTRLNALLSLPWTVQAAGDDDERMRHAAIVKAVFASIPHFQKFIARLAYGLWRSPSIQEVIWTDTTIPTDFGPLWMVRKIEDRIPDRFLFSLDGQLRLRSAPWSYETKDLPAQKFLVCSPDATALNPYGIGLGTLAFYAWQARIRVRIFHQRRLDKLSTPPLVFKSEKGDADPQAKKAFRSLKQLQNGADVHLKKDYDLDPLKVSDNGADEYERAQRLYGDELAELITGHVGAGGEKGQIDLSGGQATVTSEIRSDYQEADVAVVYAVLSEFAQWIVEVNVGVQPEGGYPTVLVPPEFLQDSAEIMAQVKSAAPFIGDRIGKKWLTTKLGYPPKLEADDEPIGTGVAPPPQLGPDGKPLPPQVPGKPAQFAAAGATSTALIDEQETDRNRLERAATKALEPIMTAMRAAIEEYAPPGKA